jgi:hypothetical protein
MKLLGKEYTKKDLLRYCGNIKQIAGITETRFSDGKADGMKNFYVKTGGGLEYTVLPGKCLDISSLNYKGINLSFLAKPGIISSQYGYPFENEFVNYMTGGMLFTAGLQNVGPSCRDDNGVFHPLHGRIGITPAENPYAKCYWDKDDYILESGGIMRESALFGHNLSLTRKITSKLGENEIEITDILENNAPESEEFMLLYHFNFGFPFLDENTTLHFPQNTAIPHTEIAKDGIQASETITKPQDGFFEHVFFRDIKEDAYGFVIINVENKALGIGAYIKYEKKNLPNLTQWKSMRSGDYALGIEPCNCYVNGRKGERENGTLKKIKPFSKLTYKLIIGTYTIKNTSGK